VTTAGQSGTRLDYIGWGRIINISSVSGSRGRGADAAEALQGIG
jgi:NAD(P)-dependent dehydrogenase (short-subunit alcohol dehydrogenase family)